MNLRKWERWEELQKLLTRLWTYRDCRRVWEFHVAESSDRFGWHFRKCVRCGWREVITQVRERRGGGATKEVGASEQRGIWLGTSLIPAMDKKHVYSEVASCLHQPSCKLDTDLVPLCGSDILNWTLSWCIWGSGERTPIDTAKKKCLKQSEERKHIDIYILCACTCDHIYVCINTHTQSLQHFRKVCTISTPILQVWKRRSSKLKGPA